MANNKQVKVGIGFDVDKSGLKIAEKELKNLHTQLGNISAMGQQTKGIDEYSKGLKEAGVTASKLSTILEKSFSAKLGTINVTKFKQELDKAGMSTKSIQASLQKAGQEGSVAFARLGTALLSTNVQIKKSNTLLDEMATTMANTVKWGVTSSIFNNISSSVQDAYHYVKQLDSSLNDIRIVTDKSAESMAKFAVQANNAAKNLGASTRDYTDASLIYYQQGLSDKEVAARAETTLKAANVTGQNTAEVSEQLTAVWNGYKVSAQEAELYVDKLAAVAATTASDLEELSTGMSKVASAASLMGVDIDQLNAQLATIVSVTREAPESIGTALKTVYARMSDIKSGLDGETTLDEYTQQMADMGVHVLDANGNLRDMGDVVEEIGGKWSSMTREQQTSLAQTIAGTRQYSRMMALFDNWDMYTDALNTSAKAAGTLQHQQDIYMETTEAHLQQLKTSAEDIYDTLIKTEEINAIIDIFKNGTEVLGTFFDTFGGGISSMAAGAAILSGVFSKQIGQGLGSLFTKQTEEQRNADIFAAKKDLAKQKIEERGETPEGAAVLANYEKQEQISEQILQNQKGITNEQYQQRVELQNKIGQLEEEKTLIKEQFKASKDAVGIENIDALFGDDGEAQLEVLDDLRKQAEEAEIQIQKLNKELNKIKSKNRRNAKLEEIKEQESIIERANAAEKAVSQYEQKNMEQQSHQVDLEINLEDDAKLANIANTFDIIGNSAEAAMVAIGSVQSIIDILNNEDLTFGEKLGQSFILLTTTLPMVINSVKTVTSALKETNAITSVWNTLIKIGSAENSKNAASEALLALAKKASAKASKDKAAAMNKDSKETKENTFQNIVNGATQKGKAGAKSLASAGKGLVSILRAIPPQAYLVAAAIAAVGAVCYATYKESIKYDEALKQANKTQKEVSENLAETKTAYEQTLSAISDYSNSKTALQDLTKGTREWNEAVLELNNNVLALMEKYPELSAEIENNNGVLEISQKGLDDIIAKESERVKQAQESLYLANTNVTQAESQKLYHKDFKLERKNENGEVISQNSIDSYSDDVDKILEEINKGNSAFLKDTSAISRVLNHSYDAELYKENATALMELAAQLQANETIIDANNQLLADSLLQDKKEYSNMSEDEQKIASTILAEQMQDFQKQVSTQGFGDRKKLLNSIDFLTGVNDKSDAELVLKALGRNPEDYEIQKADGSEFEYRKKGSDEEFTKMSYEDNIDAVYNYAKSKEIAEDYGLEYLAEKFSKLDTQIGTTTSNIISKFLATGGELSNLSEVELEAVRTALENGDLSADLIDSVFRQEQLEALGYKNGTAVVEGLKQSIQKENILKDAFDKTFKHAGNEGVQAFEKVLDGVDENTYSKLAYAMEQIDWSSSHALADLNAILEQQGVSVNTATKAWEDYAQAMKEGLGLIDAATLKQNQQEVAKIINDLDTGDRISAEEYEKIQSQSAAAASLFVEEITGEYRLVSSQGTLAELFFGDFESQALRNIALLQQLQVLVSDVENKNAWQDKVQTATDTSQSVSENGGHYDTKGHAVLNYGGDIANAAFAKFGVSQDEFSRATSTVDAHTKDYDTLDDDNKAKVDAARELIDKVYNYIDEVFSNPEKLDEDIQKNKETVAVQHQSSSSLDASFSQAAAESQGTTDDLEDLKAKSDQLRSMASSYETCSDELAEYNKILETQSEDSEDAREAYQKLNKAVKQAEWKKMAKEVAASVKEIKKLTKGTEEYDKKAQGIADSINAAFGTNVTKDFYEENKQLIDEWANSTGDKASELTMKIQELAAIDSMQDTDINFDITANDQVTSKLASLQEKQAALKSIIEANPITINAQGQADMSQLIAGLSQAGASAKWVAEYLASIGHTNISISTDNLPTQDIDLSSKEGITQFMEMWNQANGAGLNVTGQVPDVAPSMKSGGSGGGGGGPKAQAAKKQDKFKADIDPFHEINEQIDLLNTTLDRLAKKQEKAFGKDLINNLKEQNKKIQEQNENLKEKIKITDKEIAQDKYKMQNLKVAGKKVKVSFNEDGSIANYDEALTAAEKNVNDLVKKYNKVAKKKYKEGSREDTDRKELEKEVEKAKNDFNKLQELMDAYDEHLISKEDLINQMQDNIDQIIENNAAIFTTAIEIKLEVNDIRASYNDFMSEWDSLTSKQPLKVKIENELANTNIFKDNIQNATKMVTQAQAELAKIQKGETSQLFGDNEKLAYDTLKEYTTQLQNSLGDIQNAYQSAKDTVLDGMDAVNDSLNEQIENMSFYADSIQHVININEKLYGEQAAAAKNQQYYKDLAQQNTDTINTLKQNADYWKTQMNAMKGVNDEAYKKAKENYISTTQEMQSALETSLENIQAALENSIKSIFETFTNGLTPENWGFDNMLKDWEMAVSESETYLTNIDQANKLKQLELKYQQAIDKSSSLSTQKELLALKQKELNALREQGKLTQYDIDRANKKLQLRLAEIALEEAQNNKSKLRLRRDSQGNYSYQYVADEDAIAKKQAEVDNLKTEISNDDFNYFKENVTNALSGFDTFKQEFAELLASGASEEERQEFLSNYAQQMSSQSDLFNDSINYLLNSTAEATGQDLDKMTTEEKEQMLKSQFGEDIMSSGALEFLLSLSDNTKTAEDATKYLTDNIYTLAEKEIEWAEQQEETASKYAGYGEDFELMGEALGKINEEVTAFNKDSETTTTNLKAQLEGVQTIFSTIQTVLSDPAVQAGLKALKEAVGKEGDTNNGSLTAGGSNEQAGDVADTSNTTKIEDTDAETEIKQEQETNQGNKKLNKGDTVKLKKKDSIYKYVKKDKKFSKTKDKANKDSEYNVQEVKKVNKIEYAKISAKENKWVKKSSLKGFDTGGYTGRWNSSEGRLALLHQKELVLNAKDTENMLRMTKITRQMMRDMNPELLQRQYEEMTNSLKVANNKEWKIAKNQMLNELQALSTFKEEMAKKIVDMEATNYSFAEITQSIMNKMQEDIMAKYNFTIDKIKNQVAEFKHSQKEKDVIDQKVHIEATFPNVSHSREIEDAFNNLINIAAQRAYNTKRLK